MQAGEGARGKTGRLSSCLDSRVETGAVSGIGMNAGATTANLQEVGSQKKRKILLWSDRL